MRNFGNVLQNAAEIVSDAKRQNTRKNADFHFLGAPLSPTWTFQNMEKVYMIVKYLFPYKIASNSLYPK